MPESPEVNWALPPPRAPDMRSRTSPSGVAPIEPIKPNRYIQFAQAFRPATPYTGQQLRAEAAMPQMNVIRRIRSAARRIHPRATRLPRRERAARARLHIPAKHPERVTSRCRPAERRILRRLEEHAWPADQIAALIADEWRKRNTG